MDKNNNNQIPILKLHQMKITAPAGAAKPNRFDKAIIAGATAGAIESVIMFPTEFVKTQLQLQNKEKVSISNQKHDFYTLGFYRCH